MFGQSQRNIICLRSLINFTASTIFQTIMKIGRLVPKDKIFNVLQNIWTWKQSGHVTNILISSYVKVYVQNFVKESQVVSSLSSEI